MTRLRVTRTFRLLGGRVYLHTGRLPFTVPGATVRLAHRGEPDPLDDAMHTVWLDSGKWRWTTQQMTTEAREAAVAAVLRYDRTLKDGDPSKLLTRESLAWWD